FLADLARRGRAITAGFPSTTAASVASLGTGRPPGEHGMIGYTLLLPGHSRALNVLRWSPYGQTHGGGSLINKIDPEELQPHPTSLEIAARHGVSVRLVGPATHDNSGLSRAVLRGGRFQAMVSAGDVVHEALACLVDAPER